MAKSKPTKADLEQQVVDLQKKNSDLQEQLAKLGERPAADNAVAQAAAPLENCLAVCLRKNLVVDGAPQQIGFRLACVALEPGVSLNFLVDALRNGHASEIGPSGDPFPLPQPQPAEAATDVEVLEPTEIEAPGGADDETDEAGGSSPSPDFA